MKDQHSVLKEQLRYENEKKRELKQEIEKDHVRIVELERQLQEQRVSSEMRFLELCGDKGKCEANSVRNCSVKFLYLNFFFFKTAALVNLN